MKNKSIVASTVLAGLLMTLSASQAIAQSKPPVNRTYQSNMTTKDKYGVTWYNIETKGENEEWKQITLYRNGEVNKITMINDKVTEMYIGDKKVAEADLAEYEPMLREMLERLKKQREEADKARAEAEIARGQAEKMREQAALDREVAAKARQEAEIQREKASAAREQAELARKVSDKDRLEANEMRKKAELARGEAAQARLLAEKQRVHADQQRVEADKMRVQSEEHRRVAEKARAEAAIARQEAEKARGEAEIARKRAEEDRKEVEALIDELVKDKVIGGREDLHVLQLTDESLIVNDKKQSAELHQRLKNKFLKKSGQIISFKSSASGTYWNINNR